MVRGVRFQMPNERGCLLKNLLKNIPSEKYNWVVFGTNDVYVQDLTVDFLPFGIYDGKKLIQIISENEYYIVCLGLLAFPKGQASTSKIATYNHFRESKGEIAVLIVDSSFVSVYIKKESDLWLFEKTAQENHFTDLEYITPENDWFAESFHPE